MSLLLSKSYVVFMVGMALVITGTQDLPPVNFATVCLGGLIIYIGGLINE